MYLGRPVACSSYLGTLPDPISHVCSLTGKYISRKYFTYRPVQTFKIMFRRFLFSRIWSPAQDHAVLGLLLNLVGVFISTRPRWSGGNDLYHICTSFEGASRGGQPLNIFTWFIGAGGYSFILFGKFIYLSRHLYSLLHLECHVMSCHVISISNLKLMSLFSTESGKRDLLKIDWDSRLRLCCSVLQCVAVTWGYSTPIATGCICSVHSTAYQL